MQSIVSSSYNTFTINIKKEENNVEQQLDEESEIEWEDDYEIDEANYFASKNGSIETSLLPNYLNDSEEHISIQESSKDFWCETSFSDEDVKVNIVEDQAFSIINEMDMQDTNEVHLTNNLYCKTCNLHFKSQLVLARHICLSLKNVRDKPVWDHLSSALFKLHSSLHESTCSIKCLMCNTIINCRIDKKITTLKKHVVESNHDHVYFCKLCDFHTKFKSYQKYHNLTHPELKNNSKEYKFYNSKIKRKHLKVPPYRLKGNKSNLNGSHFSLKQSESDTNFVNTQKLYFNKVQPVKIDSLKSSDSPNNEINSSYDVCNGYNTNTKVESYDTNIWLLCNICKFATKSEELLENHKKCHTNDVYFRCQYCDYHDKVEINFLSHLATHSNLDKSRVNNFISVQNSILNYLQCSNEYDCSICNYQGICEEDLTNHMQTH